MTTRAVVSFDFSTVKLHDWSWNPGANLPKIVGINWKIWKDDDGNKTWWRLFQFILTHSCSTNWQSINSSIKVNQINWLSPTDQLNQPLNQSIRSIDLVGLVFDPVVPYGGVLLIVGHPWLERGAAIKEDILLPRVAVIVTEGVDTSRRLRLLQSRVQSVVSISFINQLHQSFTSISCINQLHQSVTSISFINRLHRSGRSMSITKLSKTRN